MDLQAKHNHPVIITGGTRGVGRQLSLHLAQQGIPVVALYARNSKAALALSQEALELGCSISTLKGDYTDKDVRQRLILQLKELAPSYRGLVHCAASGVHRNPEDLSTKHLLWTYDVNVASFHELLVGIKPSLLPDSRIVALSSFGATHHLPFYAAVGASKGALEALMRHYAISFIKDRIATFIVCPGFMETDATKAMPDYSARHEKALSATPTGTLTTPQNVAELIFFLLTTNAAFQMTGQKFMLDGARSLIM